MFQALFYHPRSEPSTWDEKTTHTKKLSLLFFRFKFILLYVIYCLPFSLKKKSVSTTKTRKPKKKVSYKNLSVQMETKRPMWPDLKKKKKEEEGSSRTKCRQAVLLTTGSFNPITRAHVEILEIAKRSLEKDFGYVVTNGFISPTHDDYVKDKCIRKKCKFVSSKERAHMCDLALKNNEWVRTSYWECTCFFQSYYNDKSVSFNHTTMTRKTPTYTQVRESAFTTTLA